MPEDIGNFSNFFTVLTTGVPLQTYKLQTCRINFCSFFTPQVQRSWPLYSAAVENICYGNA
jgi:hypothetical protein